MRFYLSVLTFILTTTTACGAASAKVENTYSFLGYKVKISEREPNTGTAVAEIEKDGKIIEKFENYDISLGTMGYLKFLGEDKIKFYLIFNTWSGGAHCCAGITAYELEPDFKKSFEIESDSRVSIIVDSPDNAYYIRMDDPNFLYWHTSYADSARISIDLQRNKEGSFEIAEKYYYANEEELSDIAKSIFNNPANWEIIEQMGEPFYPGQITEKVVNLIYGKHPALVIRFLDNAWNPKNPHKEQFKKDLKNRLQENNYWKQWQKKGYKLPF